MRWFRRARRREAAPAEGRPDDAAQDAFATRDEGFACSTCGRTDLPPAGDWDPPICSECDAAINFDEILESEAFDEH